MPSSPSNELLLRQHAGFVRRLARVLARDEHDAADLEQSVWLATLERPPRSPEGAREWFRRLLLRMRGRQLRAEGRRRRHEHAAVQCVSGDGDAVREKAEFDAVLAELSAALSSLRPQDHALVRERFLLGRSVAHIARQQGIPVKTVYTRLSRALERMRGRLDQRTGGRSSWALVLLGETPRALPTGAPIWTATSLVLMAASVLACVALFADEEPAPDVPASITRGPAMALAPLPGISGPRLQPTRVGPPTPAPTDEEAPALLFGRIVDEGGDPIPGLRVSRLTDHGLKVEAEAQVQADTYALTGPRAATWRIVLTAPGFRRVEGMVPLGTERESRRDLVMARSALIPLNIVTDAGRSYEEAYTELAPDVSDPWRGLHAFWARRPPPALFAPDANCRTSVGRGRFHSREEIRRGRAPKLSSAAKVDGLLEVDQPLPVLVGVSFKHLLLSYQEVTRTDEVATLVVPEALLQRSRCRVSFRLLTAERAPVFDAQVDLGDRQTTSVGATRSDEEGRVVLGSLPPGLLLLNVWASGREIVEEVVSIPAEESWDFGDILLHEPVQVTGRIERAVGELPPSLYLHATRLDPHLGGPVLEPDISRFAPSLEADGSFRLRGLGRGSYALRASAGGHSLAVNPTVVDTRDGSVADVVIPLREGVPVGVYSDLDPLLPRFLRIEDAHSTPVWSEPARSGRRDELHLVPGSYTLIAEGIEGSEAVRIEFSVESEALWIVVRDADRRSEVRTTPPALEDRGLDTALDTEAGSRRPLDVVVLHGSIHRLDGEALVRPRITVSAAIGTVGTGRVESGRWTTLSSRAGEVVVEASAEGCRPWQGELEIPAEAAAQALDIVLEPEAEGLSVRLTADDTRFLHRLLDLFSFSHPHANGAPVHLKVGPHELGVHDETDPAFARVRGRSSSARIAAPGWEVVLLGDEPACFTLVCRGAVVGRAWTSQTTGELEIPLDLDAEVLALCSVRVRFVDAETGEVLYPWVVALGSKGSHPGRQARREDFDERGRITLEHEPAGTRAFAVHLEGYEPLRQELELEPGHDYDLGTLELVRR